MNKREDSKEATEEYSAYFLFQIFCPIFLVALLRDLEATQQLSVAMMACFALLMVTVLGKYPIRMLLCFLGMYLFAVFRDSFPDLGDFGYLTLGSTIVLIFTLSKYSILKLAPLETIGALRATLLRGLGIALLFSAIAKINLDFFNPDHGCSSYLTMQGLSFLGIMLESNPEKTSYFFGIGLISWQMLAGASILSGKFMRAIFLSTVLVQTVFMLLGYHDFTSLTCSLILLTLPHQTYQELHSSINIGSFKIRRGSIFVVFCLSSLIATFSLAYTNLPQTTKGFYSSLGFVLGFLYLITYASPSIRSLSRFPITFPHFRKLHLVFILFIILVGLSPYLGLNSKAVFTELSNLKTEKDISNHLLLPYNRLRFFSYQSDLVFVEKVHVKLKRSFQNRQLEGNMLPLLEFIKKRRRWKKLQYDYIAVISYQKNPYIITGKDSDPNFVKHDNSLAESLMSFKPVATSSATDKCYWH